MKTTRNILVLDDDRFFTRLTSRLAADRGHIVEECNSSGQLDQSRLSDFDLIFLDIMMPEIDGVKILRGIQRHAPTTKVVLMTSIDDALVETLKVVAANMGIKLLGSLKKPFKSGEFLRFLDAEDDASDDGRAGLRQAALQNMLGRITSRDIQIEFQPQVSLSTGMWLGCDAVATQPHQDDITALISEGLSRAESQSLALQYQLAVLDKAMHQFKTLQSPARQALSLSTPVLVEAALAPGFIARLSALMAARGFPSNHLVMGFDESLVREHAVALLPVLQQLRASHIRVSLSFAGNGADFLAGNHKPACDEIRIDKRLTSNLDMPHYRHIVSSLLSKASRLCVPSVAEGVIDAMDCKWLSAHGCDIGQGPLITPGRDVAGLVEWNQSRSHLANARLTN